MTQLEQFVRAWLNSYLSISTNVDSSSTASEVCNVDEIKSKYDVEYDSALNLYLDTWYDICIVLTHHRWDWTYFIRQMLYVASTDYGDAGFVYRTASSMERIVPLQNTNLLVQTAIVPNTRVRKTRNAVYLGYDIVHRSSNNSNNNNSSTTSSSSSSKLFTVPLSAAWIVDDISSDWYYGTDDRTNSRPLQTYIAPTPDEHSWEEWDQFFLYPGYGGTIDISNTPEVMKGSSMGGGVATLKGNLTPPFGGKDAASVITIAAASSAAGGNGSPLCPSFFTQVDSITKYGIDNAHTPTVWRVLAGLAAGIGIGILTCLTVLYINNNWLRQSDSAPAAMSTLTATKVGIGLGILFGCGFGLLTGFVYGIGSIFVPKYYDKSVNKMYQTPSFDNFAVCSQWPNVCGETDGYLVDGWFIDNPALVINVAHYQQRNNQDNNSSSSSNSTTTGSTLKVIITNTNDVWNTTFNRAQILHYYSTYFNQNVQPGEFLLTPGFWTPYRSPQIFAEYMDESTLDDTLSTIPNSHMTTSYLVGTTINNPAFGILPGLTVEILLLNLNEDIPTTLVGSMAIKKYTEPLVNMTSHIASNEVLLQRVRDFVAS
jgi:hypothetical protein